VCENPHHLLNQADQKDVNPAGKFEGCSSPFFREGRWLLQVDLVPSNLQTAPKIFPFSSQSCSVNHNGRAFSMVAKTTLCRLAVQPSIFQNECGLGGGRDFLGVDDLILQYSLSEDEEELAYQAAMCLELLVKLGFILNADKTGFKVITRLFRFEGLCACCIAQVHTLTFWLGSSVRDLRRPNGSSMGG